MTKTTLLLPLALTLFACAPTTRAPLPSTPAPTPSEPTITLPSDASLQDKANALAETGEVTSKGVGYGGVTSPSYAAYSALVADASLEELRSLLSDDRPVIRAYIAAHLARHDSENLDDIAAVLHDGARINARYGCMGMPTTVASHVAHELCYLRTTDKPGADEARRLLEAAAADPSASAHGTAKGCLTRS
jgi:hypothetical protein